MFLYLFLRIENWCKASDGKGAAAGSSAPMLHVAASSGEIELMKKLIDAGVDLNEKDGEGWPAIHYAIVNGHFECASVLIENGVEINCYAEDVVKDYYKAIRESQIQTRLLGGNSL